MNNKLTDWIVGQAFAADLTQKLALIREHLHTVRSIVGNENLLIVVHYDTVREFWVEMRRERLVSDGMKWNSRKIQ